jgi:hypothetical protein
MPAVIQVPTTEQQLDQVRTLMRASQTVTDRMHHNPERCQGAMKL